MNPLHLQCTCINFNIYQFHYSVCTKISFQDEVIKKYAKRAKKNFLIQKDKIHMKLETTGFNDAKCSLKKFGESMINVTLSGKENYLILK